MNQKVSEYMGLVSLAHSLGAEGCAKKLQEMERGRDREIFKHASFLVRYGAGPKRMKDVFEKLAAADTGMFEIDYAAIEKNFLGGLP